MVEPADLMRRAWKTDDESLAYAIEGIDARLGKGYAKAHPALIAAFMQTAARRAAAVADGSLTFDNLGIGKESASVSDIGHASGFRLN